MNLMYLNNVPFGLTPLRWLQSPELGLKTCFQTRSVFCKASHSRAAESTQHSLPSSAKCKGHGASRYSLRVLQMSLTALNTTAEKLTRSLTVFRFGRRRRSILCCGVKTSFASAWTPHLSRVQCVFRSQQCFCSHQRAKSDQSWAMSAKPENTGK